MAAVGETEQAGSMAAAAAAAVAVVAERNEQ
jgi:hypothetical protein